MATVSEYESRNTEPVGSAEADCSQKTRALGASSDSMFVIWELIL